MLFAKGSLGGCVFYCLLGLFDGGEVDVGTLGMCVVTVQVVFFEGLSLCMGDDVEEGRGHSLSLEEGEVLC